MCKVISLARHAHVHNRGEDKERFRAATTRYRPTRGQTRAGDESRKLTFDAARRQDFFLLIAVSSINKCFAVTAFLIFIQSAAYKVDPFTSDGIMNVPTFLMIDFLRRAVRTLRFVSEFM